MNFPGLLSPDSTLPNYSFSRSLGLQTGADIDFKNWQRNSTVPVIFTTSVLFSMMVSSAG